MTKIFEPATDAVRVADLMHRLGGTSGLYQRSWLERHFRDDSAAGALEDRGAILGGKPQFGFAGSERTMRELGRTGRNTAPGSNEFGSSAFDYTICHASRLAKIWRRNSEWHSRINNGELAPKLENAPWRVRTAGGARFLSMGW